MTELQALVVVFCIVSITINQFFVLNSLRKIEEKLNESPTAK